MVANKRKASRKEKKNGGGGGGVSQYGLNKAGTGIEMCAPIHLSFLCINYYEGLFVG